jgi:hypothetical protein
MHVISKHKNPQTMGGAVERAIVNRPPLFLQLCQWFMSLDYAPGAPSFVFPLFPGG